MIFLMGIFLEDFLENQILMLKRYFLLPVCLIMLCGTVNAQYKKDWASAPLNSIPLAYTLNHFNLNGKVHMVLSKNIFTFLQQPDTLVDKFNEDGTIFLKSNEFLGIMRDTFAYDKKGLPVSITDIFLSRIIHDKQGKISLIKHGKSSSNKFYYNADGLLIKRTRLPGDTTLSTYDYDNKGRVIKTVTYTHGQPKDTISYSYRTLPDDKLEVTTTGYSENKTYIDYYDRYGNNLMYGPDTEIIFDEHRNWIKMSSRKNANSTSRMIYYYE